jgi:F-type H+-transporting ATPase subunit epsilon
MSTTDKKILGVRLLTPEGPVFEGTATLVVAPSQAGEIGLMPRHEPLVCALRPGETRLRMLDDSHTSFATTDGYLSIDYDIVTILVEQAEHVEAIDAHRAQEALRRAEEALAAAGDDEDARLVAESARRRAQNRLKVVEGRR